jgi:hypothetical protein
LVGRFDKKKLTKLKPLPVEGSGFFYKNLIKVSTTLPLIAAVKSTLDSVQSLYVY